MKARAFGLALVLVRLAAAQLSLFAVKDNQEQPVPATFFMGTVAAKQFIDTTFRVRNNSATATWLSGLSLAGDRFSFINLPKIPVLVAGGGYCDFGIRFYPLGAGSYSAFLSINGTTTILLATALEPAAGTGPPPSPGSTAGFPRLRILPSAQSLRGGEQATVAIRLEAPSPAAAQGELTIEFKASAPGYADDPAVLFPATGGRKLPFTLAAGEDFARFDGRTEAVFQAGTTAGSITFTAAVGQLAEQCTVNIPAGYVVIDSSSAARAANNVKVSVTGFDTSRSVFLLSFLFSDLYGRELPPGRIQADVAAAFRNYFEQSRAGGVFKVEAVFPVYGDISQVGAVEVTFTNSLGATSSRRISIK